MIRKCMNCGYFSNVPFNEQFCTTKCYDEFAAELNNLLREYNG